MFIGLAKTYNNLDKSEKIKDDSTKINNNNLVSINFIEPFDAQLISSSLGQKNEILLRYIYEGNNILVILNSKTKKIRSIITIKKGSQFSVN